MPGAGFVHLHNHSEYSLLDGALRISDLVGTAKEMGMTAVALTDHGNLFGAIPFYREAKKAGLKPIIGMETYVAREGHRERSSGRSGWSSDHLVLLVRDERGYRNLLELSSTAYLEGFYYRPRIDLELLENHAEGLIGLSACLQGSIPKMLLEGRMEDAEELARRFASIFAPGDFYIELQNHGIPEELAVIPKLVELAGRLGLKTVATNDCHYCAADDHEAHDVLLCLQTGKDLDDPARGLRSHPQTWFKSPDQMKELFADHPEAIAATLEIADKCDFELPETGTHLPGFPIPEPFASPEEYLEHLVMENLPRRVHEVDDEVTGRVKYELGVINAMDFAGYFLIVWDIVHAARAIGIPVGPGRGSAAGSLVCYALGITNINPLEHGLLFERFLNPERISLPDIDIDFCDERRQDVIQHVVEKYGAESVCQIITFGRMAARAVVRDVGRVLKFPYNEIDRLAKMIPAVPGTTLSRAIESVPQLRELQRDDARVSRLLDLSLKLEGLARHASTHAAGVVITPTRLVDHVPLFRSSGREEVTTQYEMKVLESIGLLKIDILGLKTLSHIQNALRLIARHHGEEIDIDGIPLDDPVTFELLCQGRTVALFQLESQGMRDLLRRLEPSTFGDITAVNALYRPGPLGSGMVTDYIDRKHGRTKISYIHPLLEPILRETYGVILYQEQVMRIASDLGGFTLGQADILRRAMGKKKEEEMQNQREAFVSGAVERSIPKKKAERIFDLMAHFAGYGFNKSHSAAYAMVSMQTAYLKAHYPAAFMAAAMTSDMTDTNRLIVLLEECRNLGIAVRPPDINAGDVGFDLAGGEITYGLAAVKNVGEKAIRSVIDERRENGPFRDLFDFCERVDLRQVNRRVIESLIQAGALDPLPGTRSQKMATLDRILAQAQKRQSERDKGQIMLEILARGPGEETFPLDDVPPWDESERLRREKESLGFPFSGHPVDSIRQVLGGVVSATSGALQESADRTPVVLVGLVTELRSITDRKGNPMAFVTLEDDGGSYEVVVFSSCFQTARERLLKDELVVVAGKVSMRNGTEKKVIADRVYTVDEALRHLTRALHVTLREDIFGQRELDGLREAVARHSGEKQFYVRWLRGGGEQINVRVTRAGVSPGLELIDELKTISGVEHVEVS
jgi:DNA polymerase-3 subunit alpha